MNLFQRLMLRFRSPVDGGGQAGYARLLIVHPSGHGSSSGPYLQALAEAVQQLGHATLLLGERREYVLDKGVPWLPFIQSRGRLVARTRRIIESFKPDVVLLVGIRCRSLLAGLEISLRHELPILLQAEDEDEVTFRRFYPKADPALLRLLDTAAPTEAEVAAFIARVDWGLTRRIWSGAGGYRLIEPVLRACVLHRASAFGAIWHPMARELAQKFHKPVLIIPPVVAMRRQLPVIDRQAVLAAFGIPPEHPVIFVAGTVYDYSDEFAIFLEAINRLHRKAQFSLVLTAKARIPLRAMLRRALDPAVACRVLNLADPARYERLLRAADIIAVPGVHDDFNRLRLPGRIPRAMASGKPIFTFAWGFGKSLAAGVDAVLTDTASASEWAEKLETLFDPATRARLGAGARLFAERHFAAEDVGRQISEHLQHHLLNSSPVVPPALAELEGYVRRYLGLGQCRG